jgi:hypothetical protein
MPGESKLVQMQSNMKWWAEVSIFVVHRTDVFVHVP